jgi:beta-aspartyl-dipeptidase (metallo-type)
VFQPTHVNRKRALFAEAVAIAKEHGVPIDVSAFDADADAYDAPEAIARCLAEPGFPVQRLTCSSDGGGCLPTFDRDGAMIAMDVGRPATLAAALAALVARGLALETVLPVFTSNVAEQLRLRGKGRLVAGADADLVVVDDLCRPVDVMARGRWMVRDGVPAAGGSAR